MSELTVIFAALTIIGHCLVIFWPRKPLKEPVDENGFPIIWCNNDENHENVACVWRDVAEQPASNLHPEPVHQQSA